MSFIKDLEHDEMRDGFLVTSQKKKLWNVELGCYNEFRRVCEKYNIKYFADWGTLLGAARHKGFIPWDDDMDFTMFRPDFQRFEEVARKEIHYPYFLDIWYENEFDEVNARDVINCVHIHIHDERTTALHKDFDKGTGLHQGIMIDISPIDPFPIEQVESPEEYALHARNYGVIWDMFRACMMKKDMIEMMKDPNQRFAIPRDQLEYYLNLPLKQRGEILEKHCLAYYYEGQYARNLILGMVFATHWFRDIVYLPFEQTYVPCPIGYDELLTARYKNWHEFKIDESHLNFYSPDISYKDFFKQRNEELKQVKDTKRTWSFK